MRRSAIGMLCSAVLAFAFSVPPSLDAEDHCTCSGPCPQYGKWTCHYANGTNEKYKWGDEAECVAACHSITLGLSATDFEQRLQAKVQAKLESLALLWNTSLSFGLHSADAAIALAAGINDPLTGAKLEPTAKVPMGSITKSWTAVALMQHVEAGRLDLDKPVHEYLDKYLMRVNGTTMLKLWGNTTIEKVTTRHLVAMRSGIDDYDDDWYKALVLANVEGEVSPIDLLYEVPKAFLFTPGEGGAYSSVGFELLGLLLVELSNLASWDKLDQKSILEGTGLAFDHTIFPIHGSCADYEGVPHQYETSWSSLGSGWSSGGDGWSQFSFIDIQSDSCLNGWTCGNIAQAPSDTARFYYELLRDDGSKLLSAASIDAMKSMQSQTTGWGAGWLSYGLGLMPVDWFGSDNSTQTYAVGHGGEDWGSGSNLAGYNGHYGFGVAVAMASEYGQNCSFGVHDNTTGHFDMSVNTQAMQHAACSVYQIVLDEFAASRGEKAPTLDCSLDYSYQGYNAQCADYSYSSESVGAVEPLGGEVASRGDQTADGRKQRRSQLAKQRQMKAKAKRNPRMRLF